MRNLKIPLLFLIFVIIAASYYKISLNTPLDKSSEGVVPITIEAGQGVASIASLLEAEGLIRSSTTFKVYVQLNGLSDELQAGAYDLSPALSTKEIVESLQHGTFDVRLTFPEGWRAEEMADYIASLDGIGFSGVEFLDSAKSFEGKLFPDTYVVPRYITSRDLVDLMVSNFNQRISAFKREIEVSDYSLEQILTLASIVEREVSADSARPLVSGILMKRLENEWPLQADATVQYVLGYQTSTNENGEIEGSWWKEHLSLSDLAISSPYNTREFSGLPPGPISNPGLESIESVLFPETSEYWYYISDYEGKMHYAVTLEEHNQNIARYLQ
jgi:UPF0755 protein